MGELLGLMFEVTGLPCIGFSSQPCVGKKGISAGEPGERLWLNVCGHGSTALSYRFQSFLQFQISSKITKSPFLFIVLEFAEFADLQCWGSGCIFSGRRRPLGAGEERFQKEVSQNRDLDVWDEALCACRQLQKLIPTLGQDELHLTPPWQMFAPTLMVPIKRELFGITEASLVTL